MLYGLLFHIDYDEDKATDAVSKIGTPTTCVNAILCPTVTLRGPKIFWYQVRKGMQNSSRRNGKRRRRRRGESIGRNSTSGWNAGGMGFSFPRTWARPALRRACRGDRARARVRQHAPAASAAAHGPGHDHQGQAQAALAEGRRDASDYHGCLRCIKAVFGVTFNLKKMPAN